MIVNKTDKRNNANKQWQKQKQSLEKGIRHNAVQSKDKHSQGLTMSWTQTEAQKAQDRRYDDDMQVETSFWAKPRRTPQHISLSQTIWVRKPQKVPKEVSMYFSNPAKLQVISQSQENVPEESQVTTKSQTQLN